VLATGAYSAPRIPDFAGQLDPRILQIHSSEYRNPAQLRPGEVLVVGASNSGAEIAFDIACEHRTWLSGRDPGHLPIETMVAWLGFSARCSGSCRVGS
jgi:putative flavoprotein involved in K+ transport